MAFQPWQRKAEGGTSGEEEEQEKESWSRYFRLHTPDTRQVLLAERLPSAALSKPEGEGRCAVEIFKLLLFFKWVRGNLCLIS